ncbi:hypothetical protein [Halobacteriovorax sp. CON-3]|uniref:hypothetical protein n=1 Tax=Halobacteriovorax sp. CON-3 TaxID=3157710 RepID=UPI00371D4757
MAKLGSQKNSEQSTEIKDFVFWAIVIIVLYGLMHLVFPKVFFPLTFALFSNALAILWNFILLILSFLGLYYLVIKPVKNFIFPEQKKLGQKLEWYESHYKHISPHKAHINRIRFSLLSVLIFTIYFMRNHIDALSYYRFYPIVKDGEVSQEVLEFERLVYSTGLQDYQAIFILLSITYFMLLLEGRMRLIARGTSVALDFIYNNFEWRKDVEKINTKLNDEDEFNLRMGSRFMSALREDIIDESTVHEKEVILPEETLRGNILFINPTGGGKTQSAIIPFIKQFIHWNAKNALKKATGIIHDAKAELTEKVIQICKDAGREDDLIILEMGGKDKTNIIHQEKIWTDGDKANVISSWIINSWINYQGKGLGEPYWESQTDAQLTKVITLLHAKKHSRTTIYDVAHEFGELAGGFSVEEVNSRGVHQSVVNGLGKRLLAYSIIDKEESEKLSFLKSKTYQVIKVEDYFAKWNENETDEERLDISPEELKRREYVTKVEEILEQEMINYFDEQSSMSASEIEKDIERINKLIKNGALNSSAIVSRQEELFHLDEKLRKAKAQEEEKKKDWDERKWQILEMVKIIDNSSEILTNLSLQIAKELDIDLSSHIDDEAKADHHKKYLKRVIKTVVEAGQGLIEFTQRTPQLRASVISTPQSFFSKFTTPDAKDCLSSEDGNINFSNIIDEGKILVPNLPAIDLGEKLSGALLTLIKIRWQADVLATPEHLRMIRPKIQVMDEAQRYLTLTNNNDDFSYLEFSRGFRGITALTSQSESALASKADKAAVWNKVDGVVRSKIYFSTSDKESQKSIKESCGEHNVKKISRTVQEMANNPNLETITELYEGNSSLSLSFTESETTEAKVPTHVINDLPPYCAIGKIWLHNEILTRRLTFIPDYWKWKNDKWSLIYKCGHKTKYRNVTKWGIIIGNVLNIIQGMPICIRKFAKVI